MDKSFDFYAVSVEEAKLALDADMPVPPGVHVRKQAPKWVRLPQSPQDLTLRQDALAWLEALPPAVRPMACAEHYPRIVNRLTRLWQAPLFVRDYLDDLVLDSRGERQGFPHGITDELLRLRDYYNATYPRTERTNVWDAAG
jgi:hypothetical protein